MLKKHKTLLYKIVGTTFLFAFIIHKTILYQHGFLDNLSAKIAYPFLAISSKISEPLRKYFLDNKSLEQIKKLLNEKTSELEKALQENIKLKATLNHQTLSQELIDFQKRYNVNGIFTKILLKNLEPSEHYYLINKGYRDSVKKDMVMIYKFQLLGKVSDVYPNHSKVKLITDKTSKISGYTNNTNAKGIVIGHNIPNRCTLAYVNHLSKISLDDLVLSSGQGLVFPEGFCLGKVTSSKTEGFTHNVNIQPLVDLLEIGFGILVDRSQIINF